MRLLARDGHDVIVVGRNLTAARALAGEVGAMPLALDLSGDLGLLWDVLPEVVVDAAGPFHAYGDDPYRLARACIAQGVHYLDLADDPRFCMEIAGLNAPARQAGVFALSGASSVPAISSAAVTALSAGADAIDCISSAILPGNRAPRGASVVRSILHQCGQPMSVPVDGQMVRVRSWSDRERCDLGKGLLRDGWAIAVPDQGLFAQAFGARTVAFRAGMELGIMNWALAAFSWMRSSWGWAVPDWLVRLTLWGSRALWPFGTDVGGMSVSVILRKDGVWKRKSWRMIVKAGDGPFIPAVPVRAILRQAGTITPGAGWRYLSCRLLPWLTG
ncbi:hypothetical protein QTO30_01795 [Yoonia sp. GPGPB17]|uniref:hypothetical protein n=1 Tax=Yoonia sp. GPGPB17 TaxID=3026147 RepID=UPI0030BFF23C